MIRETKCSKGKNFGILIHSSFFRLPFRMAIFRSYPRHLVKFHGKKKAFYLLFLKKMQLCIICIFFLLKRHIFFSFTLFSLSSQLSTWISTQLSARLFARLFAPGYPPSIICPQLSTLSYLPPDIRPWLSVPSYLPSNLMLPNLTNPHIILNLLLFPDDDVNYLRTFYHFVFVLQFVWN